MDTKEIDEALKKVAESNKLTLEELQSEVRELKAKGGRFKAPLAENTFNDEFKRTLMENKDAIAKFASKTEDRLSMEMKAVGDMTFGVNFTNANTTITQVQPGIIGAPSRFTHIRDFIASSPLGTSNYAFLKETGTQGAPATVSEGNLKPQVDFELSEVSLPAQVLAAHLIISNQMLEDIAGMSQFVSRRLLERLLVVEDAQLLSGNGISPNLSGIHNAGNFTAASGASSIHIEQIVQAISQLEAFSRRASGIILNPSDFYSLGLHKGTGSGDYSLPPYVTITPSGDITIAGVPVVRTLQQTAGVFTVGDFTNGTLLLYRNTPRIELFTDATLAKTNKTLIRIEERIALAVYGSDYIIKGNFVIPEGSI